MKRILSFLCIVLGLMVASRVVWAGNDYKGFSIVKVMVNGRSVLSDVPAIIFDGRTLLPVRSVAEALGAQVNWDSTTATVTLTPDGTAVSKLTQENEQLQRRITELESENAKLKANISTKTSTPTPVPPPVSDSVKPSTPPPTKTSTPIPVPPPVSDSVKPSTSPPDAQPSLEDWFRTEVAKQGVHVGDISVEQGLGATKNKSAVRISVQVNIEDHSTAAQDVTLAMTILTVAQDHIDGVEVRVHDMNDHYLGSIFANYETVTEFFVDHKLTESEFERRLVLDVNDETPTNLSDDDEPALLVLFPQAILLDD